MEQGLWGRRPFGKLRASSTRAHLACARFALARDDRYWEDEGSAKALRHPKACEADKAALKRCATQKRGAWARMRR